MQIRIKALGRALCLVGLLALPTAWAGQVKYSAMVVFGDSLSDTGNDFIASSALPPTNPPVPAIPPSVSPHATYWQGRFSNGPVAVEYLWRLVARKNNAEVAPSLADPKLLTKSALSFAFGGSTSGTVTNTPPPLNVQVPGLLGQVNLFRTALGGRKASKQALYVVWSGANDYLQAAATNPATIPSPGVVVGNIATAIRQLYDLGARDFLVPNLADMGITPFAQGFGQGVALTGLSKAHNVALETTLAGLESELRGVRIVEVDVFKLGAAVLSTGLVLASPPALEYLAPGGVAMQCLFIDLTTCPDVQQPAFLPPFMFWDVMHPTTQVHGVLGAAMFGALLTQR